MPANQFFTRDDGCSGKECQGGSLLHAAVNPQTGREQITGLPGPEILTDRILHALAGLKCSAQQTASLGLAGIVLQSCWRDS
jgi:hypothetical protein